MTAGLFSPTRIGKIALRNRVVMAPMTRSRAGASGVPTTLTAEYYGQRAGAGLILTEGTSPSPNGTGYPRIPGIWNDRQVDGWKHITDAVHERGGTIALQLMHTGRVSHPLNLPDGAEIVAPSAVVAAGQMYTDSAGPQPHPTPRAMTEQDIEKAIEEYVTASSNAIRAGFDGVELHGANGYLIEQFLSPHTNLRDDSWGGSVAKRIRFAVEVARRAAAAIGGDRLGMRLSPYGTNGDMKSFPEIEETFSTLISALVPVGLAFIHIVDHSSMGAPPVPRELKQKLREAWPRSYIATGGFDRESAERELAEGRADAIGFGRPFLANPDLVTRLERKVPLNPPDFSTFYTPGPQGYTDYPIAT